MFCAPQAQIQETKGGHRSLATLNNRPAIHGQAQRRKDTPALQLPSHDPY